MIPWESCVLWLGYPIQNGVWPDISKYDNDGAIVGARWEHDSLYLDGIDDYVSCGWHSSLDILSYLSIEMLIKAPVSQRSTLVAARGGGTNMKYNFGLNSARTLYFDRYQPSGGSVSSTIQIPVGWCHVVMVLRDPEDTVDFYIDGVNEQVAYTETYSGGTPTKFCIGTLYSTIPDRLFEGRIVFARVYNTALTAEQVQEGYEQTYKLI